MDELASKQNRAGKTKEFFSSFLSPARINKIAKNAKKTYADKPQQSMDGIKYGGINSGNSSNKLVELISIHKAGFLRKSVRYTGAPLLQLFTGDVLESRGHELDAINDSKDRESGAASSVDHRKDGRLNGRKIDPGIGGTCGDGKQRSGGQRDNSEVAQGV